MGNIATPNTPYCLGFQQASLSVGNKTFSTQNPPISYSIDGGTVTVFDALGAIGITPYSSDDFVEISSSPASPNTNYCSSAKAVLSWSSGTVETLNTPISYQLRSNIVQWGNGGVVQGSYNAPTAVNSASIQSNTNKLLINGQIQAFDKPIASWQNIPQSQIQVNWGNGDIETIPGSSATISQTTQNIPIYGSDIFAIIKNSSGGIVEVRRILTIRSTTPSVNPFYVSCGGNNVAIFVPVTGYRSSTGSVYCGVQVYNFIDSITGDGVYSFDEFFNEFWFQTTIPSGGYVEFEAYGGINRGQFYPNVVKTIVTSNAGATSSRWGNLTPQISTITTNCILQVTFTDNTTQDLSYPICPTVQTVPGCTVAIILANSTAENILVDPCPDFVNVINNEVTVFDSTGQIFKSDYLIPPINFQVTCYDFNITEVSYACQGDCPSGTEFRCVCPATNTIMCYGFDPDNPNVFRPLFTTQITS